LADILDDPEASRLFHSVALELADTHKGLDKERVVNVLARTVRDIHGRPLTKWPKVKRPADSKVKLLPLVWFSPSISEALQYLPPDEALALFERDELERLRIRQLFTSYLGSRDAPLYTIKQCASTINKLVRHLKDNRRYLLDTGYPRTVFKYSALLTRNMVELYPVRWPSGVREEEGKYSYTWSMARWNEDGPECAYEEAPLAPGLSIADAAQLESLRGRFYEARAEVLRTLVLCLRGDDPEALWRRTKAALTKHLSADEAWFLLRMDSSLESYEFAQPRSPLSARGAMSALLTLAGHCEKELRVGTMDKACRALGELVRKDGRGCPNIPFSSYYEVVGTPEQQRVESVCDMLAELEEREEQFWGEYEQRVNSALEEEFRTEVTVTRLVRPGYESQYRSTIETFGVPGLMTAEEVGRILSVPAKTVMNLYRSGELTGCIIGKKTVRFHPKDVAEYIERSRKAQGTEGDDD